MDNEKLERWLISELKRIEDKIEERTRQVDISFKSYDKALSLAKHNLEHRLSGMNEFREQLTAQASTYMSRKDIEVFVCGAVDKNKTLIDGLSEKMEGLREESFKKIGSDRWINYLVAAVISAVIVIIAHRLFG